MAVLSSSSSVHSVNKHTQADAPGAEGRAELHAAIGHKSHPHYLQENVYEMYWQDVMQPIPVGGLRGANFVRSWHTEHNIWFPEWEEEVSASSLSSETESSEEEEEEEEDWTEQPEKRYDSAWGLLTFQVGAVVHCSASTVRFGFHGV